MSGSVARQRRLVAAVGLLALIAAACGGDDDAADEPSATDPPEATAEPDTAEETTDSEQEGGTIGFAWTDTAIEVYTPLITGARAEAEARGYEILESNNGGDVALQLNDISTWVGQKVTGVVVLPLDPAATSNIAAEANDAGVIVVGYSDKIDGADGSTTFNHVQGGTALGEHAAAWINENLGGTAKIGLLVVDEMQVGRERIDSAMEVIDRETDSEVVGRVTAVSAADALPAVQNLLQADPDMNVVLCVADDGCTGAAQAYKAAGIDPDGVYIAGWDGALAALTQVRDGGYVKADAALDLEEIGRSVVYIVDDIRNGVGTADVSHDYVIVDIDSGQVLDDLINAYG